MLKFVFFFGLIIIALQLEINTNDNTQELPVALVMHKTLSCDTIVTGVIYGVINLCIGQTSTIDRMCTCISTNLMMGYYPHTNWETVAYQDGLSFYLNKYPID